MSLRILKFSPEGGGAVRCPLVCPCTRDCCGGGRHLIGVHTPILDVHFWPSSSHFLAPNFWSLDSFKELNRKSFLSSSQDFYRTWIWCARVQVHPATVIEYPNATRKPLKGFYIIRYHWGPGDCAACHSSQCNTCGEGRMRSTLNSSLPHLPVCPVFSWAPNESMASVPLSWLLDGAS